MEIKPIEKIAEQFGLSKESAKYYLGNVQKAFKVEKPPYKTISDFIDLASHFGASSATWQMGDVNYDGSVTISDFIDLASNFNGLEKSSLSDVVNTGYSLSLITGISKAAI